MAEGLVDRPRAGEPVALRFTKFDGSPHWQYDVHALGSDEFGVWLGGWPGDVCRRPGRELTPGVHWVTLIPHRGDWVATFNEPGGVLSSGIYVDLTTTPCWSRPYAGPWLLTCADVDLDVVRRWGGECFIDDEDEFAEHQVSMGYPAELVASTREGADLLLAAVREGVEPFAGVGRSWLARCVAQPRPGAAPLIDADRADPPPR